MAKEPNRECPKCAELGHDKNKDHLFLMADGETWKCPKDYHEPYYERNGQEWSPGMGGGTGGGGSAGGGGGQSVVSHSSSGPPAGLGAMKIRGIPAELIEKFGIKVECSMATGDPIAHYYPITMDKGKTTISWKKRTLPKEFVVTQTCEGKPVDLFGMKQSNFTPDIIVITEGELDAVAAQHMLQNHTAHKKLMCLSLVFGANMKPIVDNLPWLLEREDVVFCPDQDAPGLELVDKIALMIPKARIMEFSEKDPCAMLEEGKMAEFRDAFVNAKMHKPSSIVSVGDIKAQALKPVEPGLDYPFESLTRLTYGCPLRAIIGIGAGPGTGKTSFVRALQKHLIFEHRQPIGIFSLEELPSQSLRSLGGLLINKPVHLPGCVYDEKELQSAIDSLDGLVNLYDHHGYKDWDDIAAAITYMAHSGVKYHFIDPLSALTAHLSASDANSYLNHAMYDLSRLTQSLGITVFHVNHLNNPSKGSDHGAGGKVYGSQFSGSRAMWKFSTDMWGLERNQYADTEQERNTTKFVILKNRLSGVTGDFKMHYDKQQGKLLETAVTGGFAPVSS